MKVIHLISGGDTGGAKTHVYSLLSNLLQREITVQLVCFVDGPFAEGARALGIPTEVLRHGFFGSIGHLRREIREGGYDVLHCHGAKANFMGAILRRSLDIPVVTTVHSDYKLDYLHRPFAAASYGVANRLALRCLDYRVCVSDTMRQQLIDRGFKPNDLFSIYNGLDFSRTLPETDRAAYFAEYGFTVAPEDVIVGIAARLDPVKDIPTLLRSVAKARERCPRLRLAIAGEGIQRRELEALARELGVERDVCFLGWISDMDRFYGAIDINTLTSLSETFPYALTEGALAKRPTIASNVGGVAMLIRSEETGILFEPGDGEALTEALVRFGSDPDFRSEMGEALYEYAKEHFSVDATGARQLEIYRIIRRREDQRRGRRDGVVICGAYGFGNAGDEAILDAIVREMHEIDRDMPVTVLSRRPRETRSHCGVNAYHTFNFPRMIRAMKSSKLYINGGGNLMQDVTSRYSLWYYLYTIRKAKECGCAVQMYGCGIGPILYPRDQKLVAKTLNRCVDVITLREPDSRGVLERFGVTEPEVLLSSDPALTLPGAPRAQVDRLLERAGIPLGGNYIAFVLRRWRGFEEKSKVFAAAAVYAYLNYQLTPVFVCINHRTDWEAAKLVTQHLSIPYHVIAEPMSSGVTIGVLSRMKAVVSMRLHGLVFAAGQGVPLAGVSYDPKVTAFLDYIEQDNYQELENLNAVNATGLIDCAIQLGNEGRELRRRTELLNQKESINREAAVRLLERSAST